MLFDILLNIIRWFIELAWFLVPEGPDIGGQWADGANQFFSLSSGLNGILPVAEVFDALILFINFEIGMIILGITMWIIKVLRGHG